MQEVDRETDELDVVHMDVKKTPLVAVSAAFAAITTFHRGQMNIAADVKKPSLAIDAADAAIALFNRYHVSLAIWWLVLDPFFLTLVIVYISGKNWRWNLKWRWRRRRRRRRCGRS
jgi:p-aminobenzoyl-glutamate transporter AbgT